VTRQYQTPGALAMGLRWAGCHRIKAATRFEGTIENITAWKPADCLGRCISHDILPLRQFLARIAGVKVGGGCGEGRSPRAYNATCLRSECRPSHAGVPPLTDERLVGRRQGPPTLPARLGVSRSARSSRRRSGQCLDMPGDLWAAGHGNWRFAAPSPAAPQGGDGLPSPATAVI